MYLQQSQSKPMIMPSSSSSSNYMTNTSSNKGYLEIHHNGSDHSVSNDVFSVTWPRSNGYYSSFMKTTKRQISVDTSFVAGICSLISELQCVYVVVVTCIVHVYVYKLLTNKLIVNIYTCVVSYLHLIPLTQIPRMM